MLPATGAADRYRRGGGRFRFGQQTPRIAELQPPTRLRTLLQGISMAHGLFVPKKARFSYPKYPTFLLGPSTAFCIQLRFEIAPE